MLWEKKSMWAHKTNDTSVDPKHDDMNLNNDNKSITKNANNNAIKYNLLRAKREVVEAKRKLNWFKKKYTTQLKSKKFIKGISCPNCYGKISESKKKSLIDRNKQISIAKKKGLYNPYIKQTVNDL